MYKFHGAKEYLLDHLLCKALQNNLPCLAAYIIRSFLPSNCDIDSLDFYDFAVVHALDLCDFRVRNTTDTSVRRSFLPRSLMSTV